MVVVDDEATHGTPPSQNVPTGTLRRPDRQTRAAHGATTPVSSGQGAVAPTSHLLDSKVLTDRAMELGVLCSVLRPDRSEAFSPRVVSAARVADIVCLDWDLHKDNGTRVSRIIKDILKQDAQDDGRLRLIAVYTGHTANATILDKIFAAIPRKLREEHGYSRQQLEITSNCGVKIVCLFKTHGITLLPPRRANQVSESQLPDRLQAEFAQLAEGLLSNVALATIASIRRSTHHVLGKFTGQTDGPFFHHRALIETPEEAEEYAVDIVLSELKAAVQKEHVTTTYAGGSAIDARIRELAQNKGSLALKGPHGSYDVPTDCVISLIVDGLQTFDNLHLPDNPGKRIFRDYLSSLFCEDAETAQRAMHAFAALTSLRAYPGSHPYRTGRLVPSLGLGSIVQDRTNVYLLCVQASCDSVRLKDIESFLFVPMEVVPTGAKQQPDHVVPVPNGAENIDYVGLATSKKAYSKTRSICFASSEETRTVVGRRIRGRSGIYFKDATGKAYRWIADVKRQRALRTAQRLAQDMGRLGFDEFEPYRRN